MLNRQRTVIYDERRQVLEGADLHEQVEHMIDDVVTGYVEGATAEGYPEDWDLDQLWTALRTLYPVGDHRRRGDRGGRRRRSGLSTEQLIELLVDDAHAAYEAREEELGSEVMRELERRVVLSVLDRKWREHLYEMDYLQEGIGLRAMAQRDPLVEYQREGFDMFTAMMEAIKEESVGFLFNVEVEMQQPVAEEDAAAAEAVDGETPAAPVLEEPPARPAPARDREGPADQQPVGQPAVLGADPGRHRAGEDRDRRRRGQRQRRAGAQRAVPLRLGQEVQAVPRGSRRRALIAATAAPDLPGPGPR